jgi:hypothetical protein
MDERAIPVGLLVKRLLVRLDSAQRDCDSANAVNGEQDCDGEEADHLAAFRIDVVGDSASDAKREDKRAYRDARMVHGTEKHGEYNRTADEGPEGLPHGSNDSPPRAHHGTLKPWSGTWGECHSGATNREVVA